MLSIKNNLMAENAARYLGATYAKLSSSVQKLASGLRINSSKDDAAGLAVRELLRADVAVLQQGSRNAQDAISMLQAAEGAMAIMDDLLIRMKQLAEQSATDTYSTTQRTLMDNEFQELATEITRIAESTKFNENELLSSTDAFTFHVGSDDTIDFTAAQMTRAGLGLSNGGATKATSLVTQTVADPTSTTFLTGEATGGTYTIQFGSGEDDEEAEISVGFVDAQTYTMNEVAAIINAQSQAVSAYNAATISYDSTNGVYALTVSAKEAALKSVTTGGNQTALTTSTDDTGADGSGGVAVDTKAHALNALTAVSDAIDTKDSYRAKLGYMMNRLQASVDVLNIQAENLLAAESRISDVDVATEVATMTRTQVLAQAGISMLAQANMMPQTALQLLG